MDEQLRRNPSQHGIARDAISLCMPEEPQCCARKWYFSIQEIENHSPSRKDGIDLKKEAQLRKLYCSFLWELGMKLKVPQVTIATALMLCHRFYLRQSLAKNDWQTIATVSMFLACKAEDTPRLLRDVIIMAYEMTYSCNPPALKRIKQREVFDKQKELILIGERLLLVTIAFDLNIQHPYKPLVDALKRMGIANNDYLLKVAQNFINDWLCTTLCLQYKPHYIAAGSLFLAAKFHKVRLPTEKGKVWWLQFDVAPKQLEEVIQQMRRLLDNKAQAPSPTHTRVTEPTAVLGNTMSHHPQPCRAREASHGTTFGKPLVSKGSLNVAYSDSRCIVKEVVQHQTSGSSSATSVVEDGDAEIHSRTRESERNSSFKFVSLHGKYSRINANPNREPLERRCSTVSKKSAVARGDEIYSEVWIDGDLQKGSEQGYVNSHKKQRRVLLGF